MSNSLCACHSMGSHRPRKLVLGKWLLPTSILPTNFHGDPPCVGRFVGRRQRSHFNWVTCFQWFWLVRWGCRYLLPKLQAPACGVDDLNLKCQTYNVSLVAAEAIDLARRSLERIRVRRGTSSSDEYSSESDSPPRGGEIGEEASPSADKARVKQLKWKN